MTNNKIVLLEPKNFLTKLVEHLLSGTEEGPKFQNLILIMPNRRSGIYLRYFITRAVGRPVVLPIILSIDDFVDYYYENFVKRDKKLTEPDALYILYSIYESHLGKIDFWEFAPLGRRIYNDFEELKIYRRTKDEARIVLSDLDLPENSKTKSLLENYPCCYEEFYEKVDELGFSTRSLRYFIVSERIDFEKDFPDYRVILCPPFLLTESERLILRRGMKSENFSLVLQNSKFVIEEFRNYFGDEINVNEGLVFPEDLRVEMVSTDDDISQVYLVAEKLRNIEKSELNSIDTAIVLPDPSKLVPLIEFAIPEGTEFNVSMGYPVRLTGYFTFFRDFLELLKFTQYDLDSDSWLINVNKLKGFLERNSQWRGIQDFVEFLENISSSGYSLISDKNIDVMVDEVIKDDNLRENLKSFWVDFFNEFWKPVLTAETFSDFIDFLINFLGKTGNRRFSFEIEEDIKGLRESILEELLVLKNSLISRVTYSSSNSKLEKVKNFAEFVVDYIEHLSIPLKGTPLKGLQIIGFLETRLLSFRRVIIVDVQEGVVTRNLEYDTLLPFDSRARLRLEDLDSRNRLAKYLFFILLQSSSDFTIIYKDSNFDEPSHLILVLREYLESVNHRMEPILHKSIYSLVTPGSLKSFNFEKGIKKNERILEKLMNVAYSYTHLETYLECPVKFALTYLFGLREEIHDEYDRRIIGTVVHEILQKYFSGLTGEFKDDNYEKERFRRVAEEVLMEQYPVETPRIKILKRAIVEKLWKSISILQKNLKGELEKNGIGDFVKYYTEKDLNTVVEFDNGVNLKFTGKIDRIDLFSNGFIIIDYKSGRSAKGYEDGSKLVAVSEQLKREGALVAEIVKNPKIQLLVYLWLLKNSLFESEIRGEKKIYATIFPLLGSNEINLIELSGEEVFRETNSLIRTILAEILNPGIEFYLPSDRKGLLNRCKNCSFKVACNTFNWV